MSCERVLRLLLAQNRPLAGRRQTSRFHFGETEDLRAPSPYRVDWNMKLGENSQIVYGAQSLTGKIMSGKDLRCAEWSPLTALSLWRNLLF